MYRKVVKKEDKLVYSDNIGKKGVLLARRDNSKFVRDVYEGVINRIADDVARDDILYWVLQQINKMFSYSKKKSNKMDKPHYNVINYNYKCMFLI